MLSSYILEIRDPENATQKTRPKKRDPKNATPKTRPKKTREVTREKKYFKQFNSESPGF